MPCIIVVDAGGWWLWLHYTAWLDGRVVLPVTLVCDALGLEAAALATAVRLS